MNNKTPQSTTELYAHLADHLHFLETSSHAFDMGYEGEAKRLATSLRVLLHDTQKSKSLLGQLNKKDVLFLDTSIEFNPNNHLTHSGLTSVQISANEAKFIPFLDDKPVGNVKRIEFEKWWNKIVIVDDQRNKIRRKDLVLYLSNQDGGAHVDPNLDETYARLSRQNSLGWLVETKNSNGFQTLGGSHFASVRQIAHEVLSTLRDTNKTQKHRQRTHKRS